jgi:hypothetical protein
VKRRLFLASLAALPALAALGSERPVAGDVGFRFAVVGDLFGRDEGVEEASKILTGIGTSAVRFVLDVGSIKSDQEHCTDELLKERATLLNSSPLPLVPVAAESEWVGCAQAQEGGADPYERLEQVRAELFATPQTLGVETFTVARQSGMHQFKSFAENARWEMDRILFVTLNVPSPNNDFKLAAGRNGEFEDRVIANRVWLERAFKYADMNHVAGIVIAFQADPEFARPLRAPDHRSPRRDGFYELKMTLREESLKYRGQVLLVHAAPNGFLIDQPLQDAAGHPIKNFTRVRSLGPPDGGHWLEITADPHGAKVFLVRRRDLSEVTAADPAVSQQPQ